MIRFQALSLSRGVKPLLEQADLSLNPGEKIGLVGANGSGKSSLFALLRGELHADAGELDVPVGWRIGHVAQDTPALARAAVDYAIDGDTRLRDLEARLAAAEAAHDGTAIGHLHAALDDAGAYTARARAERLLAGLGFGQADLARPVAEFSGGWRVRLNLAQALMCPSDLLLLDEPTNHLDLDAILWLEDWLQRYPGTLIVISHDRDFLDGLANVVVHIEQRKLKRYSGNYSSFETQRATQLALSQAAYEKQARERAHLQSFIDRFKAKATKAKQAQSRMKMLAKMEELAPVHAAAAFSFEFREPERAPNPLLVLEGVTAGYPGTPILRGLELTLQAGQRIGLLGVNGAGKSTLIKTLIGELPPLAGEARQGKGLAVGYFAQQQLETLRHDQSPLWHLAKLAPTAREQDLRDFLGGFNFAGDMATQAIAPLSGGEKARLALALIVWRRPNLLLLDEPTNHLDLDTREALTVALAQFEGTLVLVSHDRHLLRASTDEFMIVADGGLRPFDGDLDDYRDWLFRRAAAGTEATGKPSARQSDKERKRLEAEARQALARRRKPIEVRLAELERGLASQGARKTEVEARLADADIYAEARKDELKALLLEQASLERALADLENAWLACQEELEGLAA
jgi:ATP-binding cassette subfamily F protein 3